MILSAPPLTTAFQVACSAAPSRTAAKTMGGMALPGRVAFRLYGKSAGGASGRCGKRMAAG